MEKLSYPRWKYHKKHGGKFVESESEYKALGNGWCENSRVVKDQKALFEMQIKHKKRQREIKTPKPVRVNTDPVKNTEPVIETEKTVVKKKVVKKKATKKKKKTIK